ncbi:MAG: phosphoesterase [Planctomycetota bacterium]|nr:MAG: phosphoesterase [Planctomycetota bacterium]REJ88341.1 MAG: phosphoesterase [Planctomycetota bacterium]REK30697.1 MAG: phosphoesterase [Planctomycetota bacterium]REK33072.1 MAG: phosphoesterase [Planctomycetota bacterium]
MSVRTEAVEHVLVVPTSLFHEVGHFQGFTPDVEPYLKTLFDPAYTSYRPRNEVEEDPSFKQLIPYCIFRHGEEVFHYRRGDGQGEGRLHSKRSIGVGGHISSVDADRAGTVYEEGMQREIREEVYVESGVTQNCIGLINDDETDVGRVHLGIVHVFDLEAPKVRPREESITQTGFSHPSRLIDDREAFETWSQICLDHLAGR